MGEPDQGHVLFKNRRLSVVDHRLTSDIVKIVDNSEGKILKIEKIITVTAIIRAGAVQKDGATRTAYARGLRAGLGCGRNA